MSEVGKKFLVLLFVVGSLFLSVLAYERIWKIQQGPIPTLSQITVDGQGKVTAIPNIAETSFTVISEGLTPSQVQDDNNKKMQAVIDYLKSKGVEAKDITTTGYYLNPKYYYPRSTVYPYPQTNSPTIVGYTLTQTITVKIRDLGKAGELVAGVVEQGINQTSGISFTVDDDKLKEYQNEARLKAFAEAKQKAQAMSNAVGVKLGKVISFSENFGGYAPYYNRTEELGLGGGGAVSTPAPIQPGSQEISASVNITYQLK